MFRCDRRAVTFLWVGACRQTLPEQLNLCVGAVAPSAPSEEGAGAPKGFRGAAEGERTRGCCLHRGVDIHKVIQVSLLFSVRLCLLLSHKLGVSLLPSRRFNPLYAVPPLPPRRSPLVLRLFALALADGSGLHFSLLPPLAALESQTPQREARRLPPQSHRFAAVRGSTLQTISPCTHPNKK